MTRKPSAGRERPQVDLVAVIEAPKGCRNKYEFDAEGEHIWLDRTLFTATQFPADYGFVADTLGDDDDPLDTIVLLDEPTFPGCRVRVRPVAVFSMTDEGGVDPKLVCVPARDPRWTEVTDLGDLPPFLVAEIEHFFDVYKEIEPNKGTVCQGWDGRAAAEDLVERARRRHREQRARD